MLPWPPGYPRDGYGPPGWPDTLGHEATSLAGNALVVGSQDHSGRPRARTPLLAGSSDTLYLAPGDTTELWSFSLATETWSRAAPHPDEHRHPRTTGAMCLAENNQLAVVGFGCVSWNDSPDLMPEEDRVAVCYDVHARTWRALPRLPEGFKVNAAAADGSCVVLLGFVGDSTETRTRYCHCMLDLAAGEADAFGRWTILHASTQRGYCGFTGAASYQSCADARVARQTCVITAGGVRMDLCGEEDEDEMPSHVTYSRRVEKFPLVPRAPGDVAGRFAQAAIATALPRLRKARLGCAVGVV